MNKQKNLSKKIISLFGIIILLIVLYLLTNNRSSKIQNPVSTGMPSQPIFISQYGEKMRPYTLQKYGLSFVYPAGLDITEETPERVVFGDAAGGPWSLEVTVEPTTFSEPHERVAQINKESTDKELVDAKKMGGGENYQIIRQIVEKQISIDGIPALVTYGVSVWPGNGEAYPERTVFFIKDNHLFTIHSRYSVEHIWESFKFNSH